MKLSTIYPTERNTYQDINQQALANELGISFDDADGMFSGGGGGGGGGGAFWQKVINTSLAKIGDDGEVDVSFSVGDDPSKYRITYNYTDPNTGLPTVAVSSFNFGTEGWGNGGILSWRSFNFQPMGTSSKLYEAGVTGLTWDITVRDATGVTAHKFVKFPTLYVQFPMKSGYFDMPYAPWVASSLTVLSMQEAIASLAAIYQFYPAANLNAMSDETIVAQFMAGTDFYLSVHTWGSAGGVVSLTFHGLNTVVTPAQWIRP